MHGRPGITRACPLRSRRLLPAALCRARASPVHRCPGSVPPSTSPLSEPPRLCVCLCPHLPGCACRLSAPPPPQDARGARPGAALAAGLAGGGRGQNRGLGPEAGGGSRGLWASERLLRSRRGGDLGVGGGKVWSRRRRRGLKSQGAKLGTEVTEAGQGRGRGGELGDPTGGAGRSAPPTPDAQPALSAPTYPRERPAGYIPTPCTPTPGSRERGFTTTHKYTKTQERLNNNADARSLPTLRPRRAGRLNARSERRKVGEGSLGSAVPPARLP